MKCLRCGRGARRTTTGDVLGNPLKRCGWCGLKWFGRRGHVGMWYDLGDTFARRVPDDCVAVFGDVDAEVSGRKLKCLERT